MKKRILCFVLLCFLLFLSVSCRSLTVMPPMSEGCENQSTVEKTEDRTEAPRPPSVPAWIDADLSVSTLLDVGEGVVDCRDAAYPYYEMVEDLEALAAYYPAWFSYRSIGQSVLGRSIYVGILGNPDAERQIVVSAAIHGREYMTAMLAMKQLELYLAYYTTGEYEGERFSELFERCCIYVVPMTNPDGVMLSQEGIGSVNHLRVRQTVEEIYYNDRRAGRTDEDTLSEYLRYWKANAVGVDLNRNYDALWDSYSAVRVPSATHYKGPSAASEPETAAMVDLIDSLPQVDAVLCIHSQGRVIYWNCGQEEQLSEQTLSLARRVSDLNGYQVIPEQNNDASLSDWAALERGIVSITVETGYGVCPLEHAQFARLWRENAMLWALSILWFDPT